MDPDITSWVLEFLARQPISHRLFNKILYNPQIPISSTNPRFKKTLLLRSIQDEIAHGYASSESILESLEIIEELDKKQLIQITNSMKLAYEAVAVDCTVKWLIGDGDKGQFFEAVKRIWRDRIENLELSNKSELVTDELREIKEEMEAALFDLNACNRLLSRHTANESLRLVKDYLKEAFGVMGPSFLELAAKVEWQMKATEANTETNAGLESEKNDMLDTHSQEAVRTVESGRARVNVPPTQFYRIPTPEFTKVREGLESSSLELKLLVNDPLPDALALSEALIADMNKKALNEETSVNPNCSLMDRNNTACTFEWSDSIDDSSPESTKRKRYHLDTPSINVGSPLKIYKTPKLARRRQFKRWTVEEEDALREAVQRFGRGNWKFILQCKRDIFVERTEVDLKDKWRNMMK
ncbi:telomere repeat-binding protein 4-like [Mercurialis annua]|uniref:telomere repeat-binding protein 4-like n=1 Tax=Mercurialis annua TaxID=3986 RepID=UPI00216019FC|nr:telomere repeat-binding protein 4-like [Mercurialis annua]XP_050211010.1 telomere repeat-binding protein 4-like [Mercurialis annua]XP_050211011.1 telomere repeat-binding protein 4-like [Mercurialis annua]